MKKIIYAEGGRAEMRCEAWGCYGSEESARLGISRSDQWGGSRCDLEAVREVEGKKYCECHAKMEEEYQAKVASGEWESKEESQKRIKCFDLSGRQIPCEDLGKDFQGATAGVEK